jgi:DNA-binding response OmpR family regulator
MGMKAIAFYGDSSDYSRDLSAGLKESGWGVTEFEGPDGLKEFVGDDIYAVLMVNPRFRLARAVRNLLDSSGGMISRIPLIAALGDSALLSEPEMLKYFDDFLVTPGGREELVCRLEVLSGRRGGSGNALRVGDLVINMDEHRVLVGGKLVDFTYKEFELLKMMAATPGRAYSREELLRSIWGYDYFGGTRTVDVHVRRLRSKIESTRRYIETVHGVGYRFIS